MPKGLKVSIKNDRIVTVEQAIIALESLTNNKISNLEKEIGEIKTNVTSLKDNEILHLGENIRKVEDKLDKNIGDVKEEIVKLKLWQAKLMGAIGIAWIVIQVILKIWK